MMQDYTLQPGLDSRKLILASQSPRRKQLLEWAKIPFSIRIIPTEETYPPGLSLTEIPIHIARQKALAVRGQEGESVDTIILAADTVVVKNGEIIGKPVSDEDAFRMLSLLSGSEHEVITGVCILGREEIQFAETTRVIFHDLTEAEIRFYIGRYHPMDKAGAYGIQEWIGVTGIKSIHGDFYNVMGLPVSRVVQALKSGRL